MSKVYFIPVDSYSKTGEIQKASAKLLDKIQSEEKVLDFKKRVPLKVHFGEDKNTTFIGPKNYDGVIDYLKQKKADAVYIETNVLYKGTRTIKQDHLRVAKKHGFTQIPIIIADGEMGEEYKPVEINEPKLIHFKEFKIGKEIADSPQLIVLAHFKGHSIAGFGGALKQLSMGCAARGGKLDMHAKSKPILNPILCKKCFTCSKNCPTDACIIDTLVPHVDYKKCIGCAKCIAVCPHGAMDINWLNTGKSEFLEKLAEYAYAAQKGKKIIYINFLLNISKDCDCWGKELPIIAKDIGVLASTDPIALDSACLDLLKKNEHKKVFSGDKIFKHAIELGFGNTKYDLVEL
ncbi:Putative dimethyl sulfoxide reductase iron-sulfur subunit B [uncultured archaeon]|nr:Putative dimethyl sulfoxide reductase iron-sulfur subunit B [uncultured archaeon]